MPPRARHKRHKKDKDYTNPTVVVGGFVALMSVAIGYVLHSSMAVRPSNLDPAAIIQLQKEKTPGLMPRVVAVGELIPGGGKDESWDEFADVSDWSELTRSCPCIYAPGSDTGIPPEFCPGARSLSPPLCGTAWAHYLVSKVVNSHEPALRSGGSVIHYIGPGPRDGDKTEIQIFQLPTHGGCWDSDDCVGNPYYCVDQTARTYVKLWPEKYNIHERLGIEFGKLTCAGIASAGGCPALEKADLTHMCTCSCTWTTTERVAKWMERQRAKSSDPGKPFVRRRPRHHPDHRRVGTPKDGSSYDDEDEE